jgi:hypothetical protein
MMIVDTTNLYQVRQAGIHVLSRELGPIAMIRFIQQYEQGCGDYSKERHDWLDSFSVHDIVRQIRSKKS